ncbi:MAG: MlaD family protein [Bradyrhizobium sp.]
MKARASNLMIGSTTLALIAAAFIGFLGIRKIHSLQQRGPLRIVFEGSASGLHKGGNVNFDGVQVGEILSLTLDSPRKIVALGHDRQQRAYSQGHHCRIGSPGAHRHIRDLTDRRGCSRASGAARR